jgi:hypothetical protein
MFQSVKVGDTKARYYGWILSIRGDFHSIYNIYVLTIKNVLIGLQCFQTLFWKCLISSFYCSTFRLGIFHLWSPFARYSGGSRNVERGDTNWNYENVSWDIASCSEWWRHARKGGPENVKTNYIHFWSQILNFTSITSYILGERGGGGGGLNPPVR